MEEFKLTVMANAFAKITTSTRCANMGRCDGCAVRYCDYRSRRDAFAAGYASAHRGAEEKYISYLWSNAARLTLSI